MRWVAAAMPPPSLAKDLWLTDQIEQLKGSATPAEASARLVSELPSTADREQALLAIVRTWSAADPQAALEWGAREVDARGREKLVSAVAGSLFATDPAAAVDLWQQLPESPRRNDSLGDAFDRWHALDPVAADDFRRRTSWSADVDRAIRERGLTRPSAGVRREAF